MHSRQWDQSVLVSAGFNKPRPHCCHLSALPTFNSVVSYAGKPIVILSLTSLFNGALTEIIFCFVLKLLIATYVADAVDEKK